MKLKDVTRQFNITDKRLDYLEQIRWPNGVCCIAYGIMNVSRITRGTKDGRPQRSNAESSRSPLLSALSI